MKLLCIGDSITWGAWDPEGGWVARVRRRVDSICIDSNMEKFILTYNLGISSDTSKTALSRLASTLDAYRHEDHEYAFVVSLGTNDLIWLIDEKRYQVPVDEFDTNMSSIVGVLKGHSSKILVLGNPSVDESKTVPYRPEPNLQLTNADIVWPHIERWTHDAQGTN